MNKGVLNGIRVLDFSRVLAGPYTTRIFADFGAEVIKVQSHKTASGVEDNGTPYFKFWNRGKRSITLDMSHTESRDLILNLAGNYNIVVENFTPRVMRNWGLTYDTFKSVKPDIIMLSLSGFGQTGPWQDYTAYGPTIQALSGLTGLTGFPGSPPPGIGFSYADHIAGLFAVISMLAALEHRDRTGAGQNIDLSEYEAMCSFLAADLMAENIHPGSIQPQGNQTANITAAPYGCYRCNDDDRWITIAVYGKTEWESLCRLMNNPIWTQESRFKSLESRKANLNELNNMMEQWTSQFTPEELIEKLQSVGITAGIMQNAFNLSLDPQLNARGFFTEVDGLMMDGTPIHFQNTIPTFTPAPTLGKDNKYVFGTVLDLSDEEIRRLTEHGVIY